MKKEILLMVSNYQNGFTSPMEMLNQLSDMLSCLGANKELDDIINEFLKPLADFMEMKLIKGEHFSISEFKNN